MRPATGAMTMRRYISASAGKRAPSDTISRITGPRREVSISRRIGPTIRPTREARRRQEGDRKAAQMKVADAAMGHFAEDEGEVDLA